ncbi:ABC transporter ATP-binding protein [Gemmobacter sp.]|uniref:ABC transporter ATP-binding protein n=1 Tax=Gemmobacter sp. TaxID=1898957 RepID=UPI002AFEE013|nr:ABC transporter ATP-binding protein [Gemmobacter sp.]
MSEAGPILSISDLTVNYGRMMAVRGAALSLRPGSITVMCGPNGAGKSTIMNTIAGGVRPAAGRIVLNGQTITGAKPEVIAAMGVSLVPEGRHVFPTMSVRENLLIGAMLRLNRQETRTEIDRMLTWFPRLRERISQAAGKLSGGEQQMLVIARALMTRPRLLLIDEPSLGLAPKIVDEVYAILLKLRAQESITLLINEQTTRRALRVADEIHVLREGKIRLSGVPAELREGNALSEAYFGTHILKTQVSTGGAA